MVWSATQPEKLEAPAPGTAKTPQDADKEKSIVGSGGTAKGAAEALEPTVVP